MTSASWPSMRYHPLEAPVMVDSAEESDALGAFWRPEPYTPEDIVKWRAAQAAQATPPPSPQGEGAESRGGQPRVGPPLRRGQAPLPPSSEEQKPESEKD